MTTPSERVQRLREERTFQVVLFDPAPRWSEEATEKVLDLLSWVLAEHTKNGDECGACGESWPCENYHLAAAALDALDPGQTP